ncbi:MAG TPA: peptide-methionine (R)-S-oxide reductase [Clostridiales bacterium UBA8960]|jgi:methionine-R-sulfoxide reductase|nr:peptide-methionine (R)-S-oxide reductase [Clostridiales bacterium UBA8960]
MNEYDMDLMGKKYVKPTTDVIKSTLTDLQFQVTQLSGTERPFDNMYWNHFEKGLYVDVVTGEPLFLSKDKFESSCGWPSFSRPVFKEAVRYVEDNTFRMHRIEVRSQIGDSHLGHLFDDGPDELGGLRYCINSASIRFIPYDALEKEGYSEYL